MLCFRRNFLTRSFVVFRSLGRYHKGNSTRCMRNVVVTGIGIVSPLGCGTQRVWQRLIRGDSGVTTVKGDEYAKSPCKVAAYVPVEEFDTETYVNRSRSMLSSLAIAASDEALSDANWKPETEREQCRTGVCIGVLFTDFYTLRTAFDNLAQFGARSVSPRFLHLSMISSACGEVAMEYSLKGPNHCVSTACATGSHAIGDAARFIMHGDADVMVAGATEHMISPISFAGFTKIRALSTKFNNTPEKASRPFDVERDGFVMGEGAAVLILEEENHALNRGAKVYARVAGYGLACDASQIVAPSDDGDGIKRAMGAAIENAGFVSSDVTYINAHATSTPIGDIAECKAISSLCGQSSVAVSSTKGATGHLLAAAGAIESAFTVLACHHAVMPPTLNVDNIDPQIAVDIVAHEPRIWRCHGPRVALSNSLGFGGTNASLCFSSV